LLDTLLQEIKISNPKMYSRLLRSSLQLPRQHGDALHVPASYLPTTINPACVRMLSATATNTNFPRRSENKTNIDSSHLKSAMLLSLRPSFSNNILSNSFVLHQRNFSVSVVVREATTGEVVGDSVKTASETVLNSSDSVIASGATNTATLGQTVVESATTPVVTETASLPSELVLDFLPEKPVPLDPTVLVGEPTFESLGLASWWPAGRLQAWMEYAHVDLGLEWYQTIAVTALCLRLISFPIVVITQRNVAHMANHQPHMAAIQEKMTDARRRGDMFESAQLGNEFQEYMKKHGINPLKNALPMMVQIPIFMSMFLGLRKMANLPVQSMETGGVLWFENLTMADPFYLLPLLTSCSLFLQLRLGVDGNRLDSMGPTGRLIMTGIPFILMPISMNFPSALTFYWMCTNLIAIVQVRCLRTPAVRRKLGIPQIEVAKSTNSNKPKKGFRQNVRDTLDNWRAQSDIADRRAMDEKLFKEAGSVKPVKTYAYDPSKPVIVKRRV